MTRETVADKANRYLCESRLTVVSVDDDTVRGGVPGLWRDVRARPHSRPWLVVLVSGQDGTVRTPHRPAVRHGPEASVTNPELSAQALALADEALFRRKVALCANVALATSGTVAGARKVLAGWDGPDAIKTAAIELLDHLATTEQETAP
jgi:hypothetical protein